mmetsp:Transcript_14617/g.30283  ORF Transcript_14617/g.30283 Transcript_14617/m.30283 type:complete len:638 (-) Transcript_14617:702-2615(-)
MSPLEDCRSDRVYRGEKEQIERKHNRDGEEAETPSGESVEVSHAENGGTNKNTRAASATATTTTMDCHNGTVASFEQASSEVASSSPAPAVEKGGENEFVRVSHLASVQVKPVPTIQKTKSSQQQQQQQQQQHRNLNGIRRKLPKRSAAPTATDENNNSGSSHSRHENNGSHSRHSVKKGRKSSNHQWYLDDNHNTESREEIPYTDDPSASSVYGNLVEEIEKSPYEPGRCAEDGESVFEEMRKLLLDDDEDSHIVRIFGQTNAGCLVKANALVEKSGMLYSQNWTKGSIRGDPVGIIPNHLLLMVLVPGRFTKASELLLSGLCRDLEVYHSVNHGLDDWGWAADYPLVRATKKNFKFRTNKRDCFKCAVFIARAHSCYNAFGKLDLNHRLVEKLKSCLAIMENHLVQPSFIAYSTSNTATASSYTSTNATATGGSGKRRKKIVPDAVLSTSSAVASSSLGGGSALTPTVTHKSDHHRDPNPKKKRGRPLKNSKPPPPVEPRPPSPSDWSQADEDRGNEQEQKGYVSSLSSKPKRSHVPSGRTRGGARHGTGDGGSESLVPRRVSAPVPRLGDSLEQLMSRFEEQYNEMGQRYAEMGTLLGKMKAAIGDNRERSEKEIRRQLLDEVQSKILQSIPKR